MDTLNIPVALQKRISELNKRAEAAYEKNNFIWASELYGEMYSLDRTNLIEYLQKMILSSLANKNVAKNPFIFNMKAFFSNISFYLQSLYVKNYENNPEDYYYIFESILRNNPDSQYASFKLSKAYEKNGLNENAAVILESSLRNKKTNLNLLRKTGDLYLSVKKIDKARTIFKKILDIKPYDQDAEKKLRDILALTSIDESKLRGNDYKNSIKDKDASYKAQIEMKTQKTEEEINFLINEKQNEIKENPNNIPLYYELLQYYKEKKDKANILNTLNKISNLSPGDINLLLERTEAEIAVFESQIEKRKAENEDAESLAQELNSFKKKKYLSLKEQFPSNADLNFQLAKIFFEIGDNDEALKLFQVCSKSADLSPVSRKHMGYIFMRKKMYDMAIDQFEKGISEVSEMNDLKKDLIYNLGLTLDKTGKANEALEKYKLIYKEDISYKDISKRIEKSYNK